MQLRQHQSSVHPPIARFGPTLVTTPSRGLEPRSALAYWHLLSLDAPTVAALWTVFLAHCSGLTLPWTSPTAMFVAVWMLYAADRLLDARPLPDGSVPLELEERHRFHQRHRARFLAAIVFAALVLAALLHQIEAAALHLYTLLAALLGAWLLLIHARPLSANSHRLPKELAVGLFFPAACFIPTVARLPEISRTLVAAAILFAAVCTLNCLFIYAWEHPDSDQASAITRWTTRHLTAIATAVVAVAILAALAPPLRLTGLACALSAVLLLWLNTRQTRMEPIHLRAAADLVLLTPLLLLPFHGFAR